MLKYTLMFPSNSSANGVNIDWRTMDRILYVADKMICLNNFYMFYRYDDLIPSTAQAIPVYSKQN
jgi:hypothetical protein